MFFSSLFLMGVFAAFTLTPLYLALLLLTTLYQWAAGFINDRPQGTNNILDLIIVHICGGNPQPVREWRNGPLCYTAKGGAKIHRSALGFASVLIVFFGCMVLGLLAFLWMFTIPLLILAALLYTLRYIKRGMKSKEAQDEV